MVSCCADVLTVEPIFELMLTQVTCSNQQWKFERNFNSYAWSVVRGLYEGHSADKRINELGHELMSANRANYVATIDWLWMWRARDDAIPNEFQTTQNCMSDVTTADYWFANFSATVAIHLLPANLIGHFDATINSWRCSIAASIR